MAHAIEGYLGCLAKKDKPEERIYSSLSIVSLTKEEKSGSYEYEYDYKNLFTGVIVSRNLGNIIAQRELMRGIPGYGLFLLKAVDDECRKEDEVLERFGRVTLKSGDIKLQLVTEELNSRLPEIESFAISHGADLEKIVEMM